MISWAVNASTQEPINNDDFLEDSLYLLPCLVVYYTSQIQHQPFYRQPYRGLKEFDTFEVVDEITPSITY